MKVLALDFDGTIADDSGVLCDGVEETLVDYKDEYGVQIVVCTGRRLSSVEPHVREFADAIVAENGGVVDWGSKVEIGEEVSDKVEDMVSFYFPSSQFDVRRATVFIDCHPDNFPVGFEDEVTSLGYELVRNNSTATIRPPEYTKSNGLRHAMAFRHEKFTIVAAGDSANDIDMLKMADYALIPANADDGLGQMVGVDVYRGEEDYFYGFKGRLSQILSED